MLSGTHSRFPNSGRDAAYTRSYRTIRLVVGCLGILLPVLLILGDAFHLPGPFHVRASLSAYYHTPMHDVFVGVLCVTGVLLATYMSGEQRTAVIHMVCAGVFIFCLMVMSLLFAAGQVPPGQGTAATFDRRLRSPAAFWAHLACALAILAGGLWAVVGGLLDLALGQLPPVLVGEVVCVWAFGISWLLAGVSLTAPTRFGRD